MSDERGERLRRAASPTCHFISSGSSSCRALPVWRRSWWQAGGQRRRDKNLLRAEGPFFIVKQMCNTGYTLWSMGMEGALDSDYTDFPLATAFYLAKVTFSGQKRGL
ncbi:hypothetical protein K437DRAFT_43432 [Tilletiaria anomala UBC 951]|uniref:Uncharacterized protein n=1 Tax=Tilletiaria anomala (strain ATCC 24038 / CBS 436.72 / UBC 951) TaxID=1037660 RepID=A0A066V6V5_TILAU|nr:uncharacterized protein K437DRAFT_43432 [Tilletiaria anomala UBC 951]KDN37211.1 hypothetical protein K437DRAFT_43432 [Tilletiaria anomala UBC 951]